ncbi:MAG TPA: alpha/beta hydrolase [Kofleriaceae bacterium]|nr:alpha/beta hydrolase [Kofleriaceae bacterium]
MSPAQWRAAGRTLEWRGHRVFVRDSGGDRPPLLLLHGFPTSSWDWRHVWDALAARYRVVAYDYVGFGFSAKPARGPYSIFAYADQAEAVLAALAIPRVDVLAHDLGDTVAQELLARDRAKPGTLASLCFLNGGLFPELHRPRTIQKLLDSPLGFLIARLTNRRRFAAGLASVFGPHTQPSAAELDGFWACAAHDHGLANYHLLIRYMRERRAHRDRWVTPVLAPHLPLAMINGHLDPVSGKHVVDHLRALGTPIEIHDLPTIGHYPQTEAPDDVLRAYFAFRATAPAR